MRRRLIHLNILLPVLAMAAIAMPASGMEGPCDIYASANTPCVAAHSTTRALFSTYSGPLYQVRRAKDNATKDIPTLAPGGYVDISVQDNFCSGTTCTISILYDQSSYKNNLVKSPKVYWLSSGGVEADAANGKIVIGGHTAHGIYVTGGSKIAYRNNATKGVATGNQAESMYAVVDGKRYSSYCCFDYGNGETTGNDDGNGTMEAIYWGTDVGWGGYGQGNGPWVAADLENGMFKGNAGGWQYGDTHKTPWKTAYSVNANYATLVLKGPSTNTFAIKAGDAQNGKLVTMWDSVRPTPNYSPKRLQGAIILGTGGDGSPNGTGTFFEGAMTIGNPPDSIDNKIQANIVKAGYGSSVVVSTVVPLRVQSEGIHARFAPADRLAVVEYTALPAGEARLVVLDASGRRVAAIRGGEQSATWNVSGVPAGLYFLRLLDNGHELWSGRLMITP